MTNEPILKTIKMTINQLTTNNYINSRPVGQKKTNPFSPFVFTKYEIRTTSYEILAITASQAALKMV
jgi:hypothetical protein